MSHKLSNFLFTYSTIKELRILVNFELFVKIITIMLVF